MLFLILSLVLNIALAQESSEIYLKPCFSSSEVSTQAYKKLNFIKAPKDKIQLADQCLDILTQSKRKGLYLNFLTQNFGAYSLQSTKPRQCHLELIKESNKIDNSLRAKLKKGDFEALKEINKNKKITSYKLNILSGKSQTISINNSKIIRLNNNIEIINEEQKITIHCFMTQKGYNLKINANDENNTLITTLFLKSGETYPLGNLNNKLNKDNKKIGLKDVEFSETLVKDITSYRIRSL
jgi:CxxC motif-containing protein